MELKDNTICWLVILFSTVFIGCEQPSKELVLIYENGDSEAKTEVVETLLERINNTEHADRNNAIRAVGEIGDERAVETLLYFYVTEIYMVRSYSYHKPLEKIGTPSVKPLISLLGHKIPNVRSGAVTMLGNIGDSLAVVPLLELLHNDSSEIIRSESARALGKIGVKKTIPALVDALSNDIHRVKESAILALAQMGDESQIQVISKFLVNWDLKEQAYEGISKLGWKPGTTNEQVHAWVAAGTKSELIDNWQVSKKALLEDVTSVHISEIQYALYSFISIGNRKIIPELVTLIEEKGTVSIANAYLNCGISELSDAATDWAHARGYRIESTNEDPPIRWGQFD